MFLGSKIQTDFDVKPLSYPQTEAMLRRCANIYIGAPEWVDADDGIKTINMAQAVCTETARLATMGIGIKVDGSARADWLQKQIDNNYFRLREWVEYGCAHGTIILKPNGAGIDCVTPDQFKIISANDTQITGAVFADKPIASKDGKQYYHRLEYHRFVVEDDEAGKYVITNKCYVSDSAGSLGDPIRIEDTPWAMLKDEVIIENINKPLFGVFRTPGANFLNTGSVLGLPLFVSAIEELRDLDVAYSRNSTEINDSGTIVLLDSDRLIPDNSSIKNTAARFEQERQAMKLPRYIRNVYGDGRENFYKEITPQLRTAERLAGINSLLSQIGFKCGFSNGYFVFNEKSGMVTATQVEADDRRTLQLIKDYRDKLEDCLDGLIAALNTFADLYDLAPLGDYETTYNFGDITYSYELDKQTWWGYVLQGKVPFWFYLTKFENMAEDEAKTLEAAAKPNNELFALEE